MTKTSHKKTTRLLIWGKTYPELSAKYKETVCTGACSDDGRPVRLYPVPLRYLPDFSKYKLYDWIEVPLAPSPGDNRPESRRVDGDLDVVDHIDTDPGWMKRRKIIFSDPSWHYECLNDLKKAEGRDRSSLGFVKVGRVEKVWIKQRPEKERREHEKKLKGMQSQLDLFNEIRKDLEFQPFRIHVKWRCERLSGSRACPSHTAGIYDWGLGELGRKMGAEKAKQKVEDLTDLDKHELAFFMGNFKMHPKQFGIVGIWYPKRIDVEKHLSQPSLFAGQ